MDDTISRAAAVALVEEVESKRLKGEIDLTYAPMIKGINALSSTQPGWIPCSERLPERYDNYLITTEDGMVVFGVYDPREKQWCRYDKIKSCWLYGIKVLAWQPLPKPWKGENA